MLAQIHQVKLREILDKVEQTYTQKLGWDASTNEIQIEGAVIDAVHHEIFNGEPPKEFAAPYNPRLAEDPRKTLTRHRRDEIKTFIQKSWQGAGGAILADEMINHTISAVTANHRQRYSE